MIYLDNSATTQPCAASVLVIREMLEEAWQNPSAPYGPAVRVEKKIEAARSRIAGLVGVSRDGVIFTGSGTEADSLAILGAAARFRGKRRVLLFAGEHPAVRRTAEQLAEMGHTAEFIPATDEGVLDLDALAAALGEDVALISCMQVNNETGAVQPLAEIRRLLDEKSPGTLLHVDGIQGFLRLPLDMERTGADLYSVSAHKVHGPKGVGALCVRRGIKLAARTAGGGQEMGLRSGTENTAGIAAFAAAADWVSSQQDVPASLLAMKLALYTRLAEVVPGLRVNGPAPDSAVAAPHILNVSLPGVGGEVLLHALEAESVLVGTGAACSSKKREMSAAFAAMRAPAWAAESAVRFSFGLMNTIEDAEAAVEATLRCWQRYKPFQRR